MDKNNLICVGKFTSPHGLKGLMKLMSYTQNRDDIASFSILYNKGGSQTFNITIKGMVKEQYLVALDTITSKEDAALLRNIELYADKSKLPDLEDDDLFYINDLIGLNVLDSTTQAPLGTIKAVHNFGAGDIIDIQPPKGSSFMLLFTPENFPTLALEDGYITCTIPETLSAKEE